MSSGRPHPPSAARIAMARAGGHLPIAPLTGVAASLAALIAAGFWLCADLHADLLVLARRPLDAIAHGDSAAAFQEVASGVRALCSSLALGLVAVLCAGVVAGLVVQGPAFGAPWRTSRLDLGRLTPSRTAGVLWCIGLVGCAALTVRESMDASLADGARLARTCAERVLALTLPCMVIDAAFARARYHASLWLTPRAQRDEQRAAHGAPEIRAARARLRSERGATS